MPERLSALDGRYPVGRHPAGVEPGVLLREIVGWDLVQAAGWRGRTDALAVAIERTLGLAPPRDPSESRAADGVEVLSVAPRRFWCIVPDGDPRPAQLRDAIEPETGCVTGLGHSHTRVRVEGPAARRLLARDIAVDLDPAAFATGRIARTALHHVPVTLQCIEAGGSGTFDLYLPRTLAPATWEYLLELARTYGHEILATARRDGRPAA